jgi:hypothetical protein
MYDSESQDCLIVAMVQDQQQMGSFHDQGGLQFSCQYS